MPCIDVWSYIMIGIIDLRNGMDLRNKGYEPVDTRVLRDVKSMLFLNLSDFEFLRTFSDMNNASDIIGMPWFCDMNPRILFCAKSNNASDLVGMPWFGDMNPRILFCAKSNNASDIIGMPWFGDMNSRILFCAKSNNALDIIGMP